MWRAASVLGLVAASVAAPSLAAGAEMYSPLRLKSPVQTLESCRAFGSPVPGMSDDVVASLDIDADGTVTKSSLPGKSSHWLTALADCAVRRLEFTPATIDGKRVRTSALLTLTIARVEGGEAGSYRVSRVGELATPARMRAGASDVLDRCLGRDVPRDAMNRFVLRVKLDRDGGVVDIVLPPDPPSWMERTTACLKEGFRFLPAMRDGVAVEFEVSVPIALRFDGQPGEVRAPEPPRDAAQVEEAYRACYPPDQAAIASVFFRFDVNEDGSVGNARMIRGSGHPDLDQAGACILTRLRFTPLMRGGKAEKSTITWELPLRPPR